MAHDADGDEDPWGFLTDKYGVKPKRDADRPPVSIVPKMVSEPPEAVETADGRPSEQPPMDSVPAAPVPRVPPVVDLPVVDLPVRERGEIRGATATVSLRRRAWPLALSLLLVSIAGFLAEVAATAQVIDLVGPQAMLVVYPLSGLGLIILALTQYTLIDGRARLPMIRLVGLMYFVAFAVSVALLLATIVPVVAAVVILLLADQLNFLLPLMIWSLAADEFNVAEGRKIFGWIVSWTYAGQVFGLLLSVVGAPLLVAAGVPLPWLLAIAPLCTLFVAVWLPRAMRDSAAAKGLTAKENLRESIASAWSFVSGIPVWRSFLNASLLTFTAGTMLFVAFLAEADDILGSDAEGLQVAYGAVILVSFLLCWLLQRFAAERIQDRIGIPGVLLILPIAAIGASLVLLAGMAVKSLLVMSVGFALWLIPRWSVDENARRAALALVPDERRTRVSFIVDLGPVAVGLIGAGLLSVLGVVTGQVWLIPAASIVLSALAIPPSLKVLRGWDDSLLSWRMRRRKRGRSVDLGGS